MNGLNRKTVLAAMLAVALAAAAMLAGCQGSLPAQGNDKTSVYGAENQNPASTGITVSGRGSVTVKPDMASLQLGVQTMDADAGKARKANDDAMSRVMAALKGQGVAENDITTTNYSIYPQYDSDYVKITSYVVTNTVNVKVRDLKKLGGVISTAVSAGANSSYGISFDVQDRTAAYNQALAQAMDKAKVRAELMAKECGVKLGRVMTVSESSYSPGPTVMMDESWGAVKAAGETPVSAGQMDITASVNVVYEIVK
jgi:uncharacterized protein YggE